MIDFINGAFLVGGSFAVLLTVFQLYKHKIVRGNHWGTPAYFMLWGLWNLLYFNHLDQPWSGVAAITLLLVNCWRLILMLYYIRLERQAQEKLP